MKPPFKVCLADKLLVPKTGVNLKWGFWKTGS
jgi:hypothetical protein